MKPKAHMLVVDDEEDILDLVKYNLEREGYKVTCTGSGERAVEIARREAVDLIVLDLMLPGIDGLEVTRSLKGSPSTADIPIVMLSAKGEEADIVTGLELGADDYVPKPFSPRELLARVRAVRRRTDKGERDASMDEVLLLGEIEIRPGRVQVKVQGQGVELTFSEFSLLLLLARRPGWVFTRSQIVDGIRGDNYAVTDRSVDVIVAGLRKKLGACSQYVETVRGIGYRFKEV
ncbi:response regulator [Desulfoluna butyratoxydans]|uniref:Transcriptional regulatory protein c terminal n=1 Tax=Desulfoluna butyratoxydans TaxID=231438 RepID=A0A4U8YJK1_9BACT|nr:response regulator [Desulfoluna butyratoxydans]VFQ43821.1 transcriptional regulatory protein c terminal [Desulfoluna butyratoxydans]